MRGARRPGVPTRIARTDLAEAARASVAAGLTWQTCAALLHTPAPYAGAVAALLIVETTVVRTVSAALRYGAGCLLGVLVAVPAALYARPVLAGLALVAFASVLPARHGFFGHHGVHVPMTALLTFALVRDRHPDEVIVHLAEIVLGIAFGLACSALLCPAVRVRSAERALEELRALVARYLDGLADAVLRRERPRHVLGPAWERDLDAALERARTAVAEARESTRWNVRPAARRRRPDDRVLDILTDVARRLAATGRLLDARPETAGAAAFARPYTRLLRTTALCAYCCRGGRPHPALPAARHALTRLGDCAPPAADPGAGRLLGHLDSALTSLSAPPPARAGRARVPLRPAPRR
ncbi:hypothetical protein ACF1GW_34730 [Streptomyces achromogenes]|uniref:hypothetical protein n=1 Tax=Streptomyces achromogenes TaxID=67255 RepID=UPI0036FD67D2